MDPNVNFQLQNGSRDIRLIKREGVTQAVRDLFTSSQVEQLGAIGITLASASADTLLGYSGLRSLGEALMGLKRSFSGENKKVIDDYVSRIIDVIFRVERIKSLLGQKKLCLKTKPLDDQVEILKHFLDRSKTKQVLSKTAFEAQLTKILSDMLYHFSMFLSDFTIMIFALSDPENENNKELLNNLRSACSKDSSSKKKASPKQSPVKVKLEQFLHPEKKREYSTLKASSQSAEEEESEESESEEKKATTKPSGLSAFFANFKRK